MSLEATIKDELEEVLEREFPKGTPGSGRGGALMIFAEAMTRIRKTVKAFGACESCYGKGYATSVEIGRRISYCKCDRGKQLERIIQGREL